MPVLFQSRIYRKDCQANRKANVMYLFGDNVVRQGYGGQAAEMRDAPNCVGIATKWTPTADEGAYFNDKDFDQIVKIIDQDLKPAVMALEHGATVIIPLDGLGTGLSELPQRAPRVNAYLVERLHALTKLEAL